MADLNVTVGSKYPVLINGNPATSDDTFAADPGGIIDIHADDDFVVKLFPLGIGETDLTDTETGGASGSAHVIVSAAPLEITLGDPEAE